MSRRTQAIHHMCSDVFAYRAFTFYGAPSQKLPLTSNASYPASQVTDMNAYNTYTATACTFRHAATSPKRSVGRLHSIGLDWSHFVRHYFGNVLRRALFSFPLATEMFHFARFPRYRYVFTAPRLGLPPARFPRSEISGSKVAYHLAEAYRRLQRPSSARSVQPSAIYS